MANKQKRDACFPSFAQKSKQFAGENQSSGNNKAAAKLFADLKKWL